MTEVGVAVIGYGMMGGAHAYAYAPAPRIRQLPVTPRLRVISSRDAAAVERAAAAFGFEEWTTDWREAVESDDVQIVDVCTPPGRSTTPGPCARSTRPRARACSTRSASTTGACRAPLLKRVVDEGAVGEVQLWRATWLSDEFVDPSTPFDWRFDVRMGGTTIAHLGANLIDLARWIRRRDRRGERAVGDVRA